MLEARRRQREREQEEALALEMERQKREEESRQKEIMRICAEDPSLRELQAKLQVRDRMTATLELGLNARKQRSKGIEAACTPKPSTALRLLIPYFPYFPRVPQMAYIAKERSVQVKEQEVKREMTRAEEAALAGEGMRETVRCELLRPAICAW